MSSTTTFAQALQQEQPLQVPGVINAYTALLAQQAGFKALYLSGAGVANAVCGLPDLGMTHLGDLVTEVWRITRVCDLPLLVDVDAGGASLLALERCVRELEAAGAAGVHIEDQVAAKRCGHRPGKMLVSSQEMAARLQTAAAARRNSGFWIMARTDALAVEGLAAAIKRSQAYTQAGADAIFAEAFYELDQYRQLRQALARPVLANQTEWGQTPLYTYEQLQAAGVDLILYPLSAFRAMSYAAQQVFSEVRQAGTQEALMPTMQNRENLYQVLDYYAYEQRLDSILQNEAGEDHEQ